MYVLTGEFGIPTVYKPDAATRGLRKLLSQCQLLNRQIRMLKNNIQATLADSRIHLTQEGKNHFLSSKNGVVKVKEYAVSAASEISVRRCLELLWRIEEEKEKLHYEILIAGEPLKDAVKLLITIKGMVPFVALVFPTNAGEIKRFRTLRKMNAYLGLVPRVKDSGGKTKPSHIIRESRKFTHTLLTQSIYHASNASPYFRNFSLILVEKRGEGRARMREALLAFEVVLHGKEACKILIRRG